MNSEQLSLFNFATVAPLKTIHDPYWDEITCDKVDEILRTDDLDTPADSGQFLEKEFAPEHIQQNLDIQDTQQAVTPGKSVRAQVNTDTQKVAPEQYHSPKLTTAQFAPEQSTHWVETYWVKRGANKYWYYRYCWMLGRKKTRLHLGSVSSAIALKKKEAVEIAIADGETPSEIRKLIKEWGNSQRTSETSAVHPKS